MRLIDADALKDKIEIEVNNNVGSYCDGLLGAEILIDNAPTVDLLMARGTNGVVIPITRHTGEWIEFKGGYYKCDKCGEVERAKKNYCSNCGAEMRNVKT